MTSSSSETSRGPTISGCWKFGDNPKPERCDLAIEVAWTRGAIDKLEVYKKLAVKEVWIWKAGRIEMFSLREETYAPIEGSELLPGIDLDQLLQFVDVRPMTRAVTEYRAALRR